MDLTWKFLSSVSNKFGDSFYLLDSRQFICNFQELLQSFREIYPNTDIAYSYKTNYVPKFCKLINMAGGFAEVVSEMELELSKRIGVSPEKVFFNGPYKSKHSLEQAVLLGGTVNLDSLSEIEIIKEIAKENPEKKIFVGIRCNFDIGDGKLSRFGFDVADPGFRDVFENLSQIPNISIHGLHCHYPTRNLDSFVKRTRKMISLTNDFFVEPPDFISLGGGFFGKMGQSLIEQFDTSVPTYQEYANAIAHLFRSAFPESRSVKNPKLIIEPGSAIAADTMKFAAKVISIKKVRGQAIATVSGSIYNINPTLNSKNLPITVIPMEGLDGPGELHSNLNIGGYTCIESDYLFRNYSGPLQVGDFVVFDNVGSYSIVLKPPFILPNFAILEISGEDGSIEVIKDKESFEDIFHTYKF